MESSSTTADVPRSISVSSSRRLNRSNHRLFFDRRYGWVFDEWKHPSQEALAGGRGMFCILPLAQGLFKRASDSFYSRLMEFLGYPMQIIELESDDFRTINTYSPEFLTFLNHQVTKEILDLLIPICRKINLAANFTLKVYENPDLISPQALQSILDKRLNELKSSIEKPDFSCFALKGKSSSDSAIVPSRLQIESAGSQTG